MTLKSFLVFGFIASLKVFCQDTEKKLQAIKEDQLWHPYEQNWESLAKYEEAPEWFADSKLGIYFHWGVYSVPAFGSEWYPWYMYRSDGNKIAKHHLETYGDPADFNYHDFVPDFTAEHFDAEEWAQLFKDTGAKFGGPVAEHHDGFAMWDSKVNPWNAANRGPKQDITGKLAASLKSRGLKLITTFHHARNSQRYAEDSTQWGGFASHYTYNPRFATSSTDPDISKLYGNLPKGEFDQYWYDQLKEVIDQYSPDIIWFDTWLNMIPESYRQKFAAYYLNEAKKKNQEVVIAYKQNDMPKSLGILDIEQGGKKDLSESVWLTDVTLSKGSWCYVQGQEYKPAELVIRNMIDVWSKNGIVLLNISPTSKGIINQEQRDILGDIGVWMKANGEAVYGTRPFDVYGFGDAHAGEGHFGGQSATVEYSSRDGRFLKSKDGKYLYLFMLGKPEVGTQIEIKQLAEFEYFPAKGINKITVLESGKEVDWELRDQRFYLSVPDDKMNDIATVFKFELK